MKHLEPKNFKKSPEKTIAQAKRFDDRGAAGRTILLGNYDDQDLQSAVETLDLESSLVDTKTLQDMSHAIDDLRAWKKAHEQETRDALNKLQCSQQEEEKLQFDDNEQPQDDTDNDSLLQQQQRSRNVQAIDHRKEYEAYQLECNLFPAKSETTDIEQALQITDFEGLALSRLRKKVFELDVKQRQEALLYELQKADADLDMNIVDVQNFTSELNAILAQFDKITLC
ncbi:uncharacterized protein PHALS_11850 [Plasmopara halstedii]|uniref:Uncharacterized protein n=1 Tax=Plasmopara halstedii TaxID=4781 RepID=A0A0P1AKG4_PLAHL|nr:uncharacterized protein PHALS_11850 [Plasmopara halstedii]CEG41509.1 hypothetical protein PHALS_11850 [Plasmopara halstedii]|eukprot:XP_024577878.1 hypothetical protein PHALS_11850 [Plasmopara halstedii]